MKPQTQDELDKLNLARFERRWDHLNPPKEGCWIWTSTVFKRILKDGTTKKIPWFWVKVQFYGNKQIYARRWAWEYFRGKIRPEDAVINVCGEQQCVRPDMAHNHPVKKGDWLGQRVSVKTEEEMMKG